MGLNARYLPLRSRCCRFLSDVIDLGSWLISLLFAIKWTKYFSSPMLSGISFNALWDMSSSLRETSLESSSGILVNWQKEEHSSFIYIPLFFFCKKFKGNFPAGKITFLNLIPTVNVLNFYSSGSSVFSNKNIAAKHRIFQQNSSGVMIEWWLKSQASVAGTSRQIIFIIVIINEQFYPLRTLNILWKRRFVFPQEIILTCSLVYVKQND